MLCLLHHIPTEETIRYALGCAVPKPVDPQWLSKAQTALDVTMLSLPIIIRTAGCIHLKKICCSHKN